MNAVVLAAILPGVAMSVSPRSADPDRTGPPSVRSRALVFSLSTDALSAASWQNRLAGAACPVEGGCELEVDVGETPAAAHPVRFRLAGPPRASANGRRVTARARSEDGSLAAELVYTLEPGGAVMRKHVEIVNAGAAPLRLLSVVLGRYPVRGRVEGGDRGFPLYLDGSAFVSVAHPSGYAHVEAGQVVLRHYPGARLAPGARFACAEAVYGVARPGEARAAFVRCITARMRRVRRRHDRPYAVLESFGGQPNGDFWTTESYLLDHLDRVAGGMADGAPRFDFYATEFWHDRAGDLKTFNRTNFPGGFGAVRDRILALGMRPGLWIDSGGLPAWTIDQNPAVRPYFTHGDGTGEICRACEPVNDLYRRAFIDLVREQHVGLLKFDNLGPGAQPPSCDNPAHDHLPGPVYSVEAIHNGVIRFLRDLDAACPDVFVILYWGYRSPWWLLYADMYFECGEHIEAASPSAFAAPYARDAVTQRLDQAQKQITDTPWLGKDSLGVWLSDWPWNSGIGKARWQEGLIMDLCRGSLLAQVWTDTNWLSPPERRQLGDLVGLLRANPACFRSARLAFGDPDRPGPYGYVCSDGRRAFVAINNACLEDRSVALEPGPGLGLPARRRWDAYRWYPDPARLPAPERAARPGIRLALRPYEVVLLEIVPAGRPASLDRAFAAAPGPAAFDEPSRRLELADLAPSAPPPSRTAWQVLAPEAAAAEHARLAVLPDAAVRADGPLVTGDVYTITGRTGPGPVTAVLVEALVDPGYPGSGPGRAENGNFQLADCALSAGPADGSAPARRIGIRAARADFSQTSHGGWPVEAAIDGDPRTAWSIFPQVGVPHAVLLELETPVQYPSGSRLTVRLTQGERGHALGRFRLQFTGDAGPELPADYRAGTVALEAVVPATRTGGLLLLTGGPTMPRPSAAVDGRQLPAAAVWSETAGWPCSWQAYRVELGASDKPRTVRLEFAGRRADLAPGLQAHWLPR